MEALNTNAIAKTILLLAFNEVDFLWQRQVSAFKLACKLLDLGTSRVSYLEYCFCCFYIDILFAIKAWRALRQRCACLIVHD